jgi:HAD superfamily hydrolase (TIGR01484 family)
MRYLALACDYDGTLATDGRVPEPVVEALQKLRRSGRRLVLATGRELEDLRRVFSPLDLFDRIVAENGALLYAPETREETVLGEAPPPEFAARLRARGIAPLSVGRAIVATWEPHQDAALETIRELGLELQVIFNKGAVMVLPSGINKGTGVRAALRELGISQHNCVAIGDAENDHALLAECEIGVAVQNGLPMLKERADWVTRGARGDGVIELAEGLLDSDLRELEPRLTRWNVELGEREDGEKVSIPSYGPRLMLCGTSGSGKSTLVTALLERLADLDYRFCLVDPEGDYDELLDAVVVGGEQAVPTTDEVVSLLARGDKSAIVNLMGVPFEERPGFFAALMARLLECRARCGRPHWIVVDEAHHMLPEDTRPLVDVVAQLPKTALLVTVHSDRLARPVLRDLDALLVVGAAPRAAVQRLARILEIPSPEVPEEPLPPGVALLWSRSTPGEFTTFRRAAPRSEHHRHRRKYAAGSLGEDKSFFFRGPENALNLRAHNLALFLQIADGVDDATWMHHLHRHDYSTWLREAVKNDALADEVAQLEGRSELDPRASRKSVRTAIERYYTLPE